MRTPGMHKAIILTLFPEANGHQPILSAGQVGGGGSEDSGYSLFTQRH
jgi:hypothetical protein